MSDNRAALREPFPTNTIKVKPQSVTADNSKGLVTFYVDARIVAERLNEVVGSEGWTDEYKVLAPVSEGAPVECRLTLNGVTKADVGQVKPGDLDDKTWKSSYSDAFKRAAVKFGVGAYLYESPDVWVETKVVGGKVRGFSDNGKAQALAAYAKWTGDSAQANGDSGREAAPESGPRTEAASNFTPPVSAQGTSGTLKWKYGPHSGMTLAETPLDFIVNYIETGKPGFMVDKCKQFLAENGQLLDGQKAGSFYDDVDSDVPFDRTIDGLGG